MDEFGIPRARLDWRVADSDWQSIRTLQDVLDEELRQKRIGFIENKLGEEYPEQLPQVGNHHMGTTRMHRDPTQGVVDAHCRVHGLTNLYVAGSSVFTRAGAANPTLSIIAFSCRLASHLMKPCKRSPSATAYADK